MTKGKLIGGAAAAALVLIGGTAAYAWAYSRSETVLTEKHALPASRVVAATSPEDIAAGKHLVAVTGCQLCHGPALQGPPPRAFIAGRLGASNLTLVTRERTDAELDVAIRHALNADGTTQMAMPAYAYGQFTDQQAAQIIGYLRSLKPEGAPVARTEPSVALRFNIATGRVKTQVDRLAAARTPMDLGPAHETGRRIAATTCGACHGSDLGGSRTLTGPDITIRNYYDRAQFHELMSDGMLLQGSSELMQAGARNGFSRLTRAEVDALYDYLLARDVELAKKPE